MSLLRTGSRHLLAAFLAFLTLSSAALATCATLSEPEFTDLGDVTIRDLQRSLEHVYLDPSSDLKDGIFGTYTRQRLTDLCLEVRRPAGSNEVASTLELVAEYLALENALPDWFAQLSSLDLTVRGDVEAQQALGLRLAGTVAMKSMAIGRRALPYPCVDPGAALEGVPVAQRALATLTRLFRNKSERDICQMMPVTSEAEDWRLAMNRLGEINERRPGGLQVLHSKGFLDWIRTADTDFGPGQTQSRLRRLTGTLPAVLTLIDDYNAQFSNSTGATSYVSGPCSRQPPERTLTYFSLTEEDVKGLDFLVSLSPKLDAFRAEKPGFDNPQALWRDLRPVLAEDLDDCILREIERLVLGPEKLPLTFKLNPSATEVLLARKELETAAPVLTALADVGKPTKAELVNRIKADLLDAQNEIVDAMVAIASDTMAAGSEPALPQTDTPQLELDVEGDPGPSPMMTVTDATDQAVQTVIDRPELIEKLRDTPMADATVPELIRSQARAALVETADALAQRAVDAQIALIEPAVTSEWTLSDSLRQEILAIPFVRATIDDATADGIAERLAPLVGVSYPSFRLFDQALQTVSAEKGKVQFSKFVIERIVQTAEKEITDPQIERVFEPLAVTRQGPSAEAVDCKCVPKRTDDYLQVYGFYPFWLAPTPPPPAAAKPADAQEDDAPKPQLQTQVDFGTVSQLAFYGLEFTDEGSSRVTLRNEEQWEAGRRAFVNSAHQYRARADLAFDLRGWMDWDEATIEDVVAKIAIEMQPFDRFEGFELRHFREALPTLFDPVRPDGVTLIFHGYSGYTSVTPSPAEQARDQKMVRIIKATHAALPRGADQRVNVAFDFPLELMKDQLDKPIFDALHELMLPTPNPRARKGTSLIALGINRLNPDTPSVIDKILLFLERPTTDAKKGLRFRMEQGLFQGETRRQALRSIIPVVPPGGHRLVRTSVKENAPDQSTPDEFSQFDDDVVYFKDNFAGIGFWPVLDPRAVDTGKMNEIIAQRFDAALLPPVFASMTGPVESICTYACPNRAKIALAAMFLFVALVLLTWRSFYSGAVDRIAFRVMYIGVVWIGNIILVGTLFVLSSCDPFSVWPNAMMWVLVVILGALLAYNGIERIRNGPKP